MGGDVRSRLARRVVAQAVGEPIDPAERALGAADVAERDGIGREQLEDRDRVGARPFAQRPCLVPANRARGREPHQRHPARMWTTAAAPARESRCGAGCRWEGWPRARRSRSRPSSCRALSRTSARASRASARRRSQSAVRAHQMFAARHGGGRLWARTADCRAGSRRLAALVARSLDVPLVGEDRRGRSDRDHRHARPEEKARTCAVALERGGKPRIVEAERDDFGVEHDMVEAPSGS